MHENTKFFKSTREATGSFNSVKLTKQSAPCQLCTEEMLLKRQCSSAALQDARRKEIPKQKPSGYKTERKTKMVNPKKIHFLEISFTSSYKSKQNTESAIHPIFKHFYSSLNKLEPSQSIAAFLHLHIFIQWDINLIISPNHPL